MLRASISVSPEALALEHVATALPDLELEAERIAAHSTEWVMPCLWIGDAPFDAVEDAFRADPSVTRSSRAIASTRRRSTTSSGPTT